MRDNHPRGAAFDAVTWGRIMGAIKTVEVRSEDDAISTGKPSELARDAV